MYNFTRSIFLFSLLSFFFTFTSISQTNVVVTTYEDINGNGILNGGEPTDIVTPQLWQDTDMNGTGDINSGLPYIGGQFTNVPNGFYEVIIPANSGSYVLLSTSPASFSFQADGTPPSIFLEAGYYIPATIGDFVWEDLNANGQQDGGEPGLSGVSIDLNGTTGLGVPVNLNTTSGGGGAYIFTDLEPGTYTLTFNAFAGYERTFQTLDSDPNRLTGVTAPINILSDDDIDDIDAGYFVFATVSDFVWEDLNGDGIQDGGEPGINGVTVTLTGNDGFGNPVNLNEVTAGGGLYEFIDIVPGTYTLNFALPSVNHFYTQQDAGGDNVDSDADNAGDTAPLTVISDDDITNIDAGMFLGATIGDYTWIDFDGDGIQNDPLPLGGVSIAINDNLGNPVNDANGIPVGPQVSDGAGNYSFTNLTPGTYVLTFTAPGGYFPTTVNAAGGNTDATDVPDDSDNDQANGNMTFDIEITSGEVENDIDAGFYEPITIGDFVWHDANADGIQDGGEMGYGGVTLTLQRFGGPATDVNGNPLTPVVTDGAGMYEFMNVRPGLYDITITPPPMWLFSDIDATNDDQDSDFNNAGNLLTRIDLTSGQIIDNIDAGIYKNIDIIGTIWVEGDANSTLDGGESLQSGVEVHLISSPGGTVIAVSITNADGEFMFNVKPGDYLISVISSNFGTGNPLNGLISCGAFVDANIDTDLDDNGDGPMQGPIETTVVQFRCGDEPGLDGTVNETIDMCFTFDCNSPNALAAPSCDMVMDTFCDLTLLDVGCARMPNSLVSPAPSPLCNGGGVAHNMSWFAFVAGTGSYQIEIDPFGCTTVGGQQGVQMGIYEDCTFATSVECINTCVTGPTSFSNGSLIPGNTYYFWIDGCGGSVCSYNINIIGNFQQFTIPDPTTVDITSHMLGETVCPNSMVTVEVPGFTGLNVRFIWRIIDPLGNISFVETTTSTLDYTVTMIGNYTIEIFEVRNKCDLSMVTQSIIIPVANPDDEDFGLVILCPEDVATYGGPTMDASNNPDPNGDGTLGWQDPNFTFMVGNNLTTINSMGCVYDQEVEIQTYAVSPPEQITLTLCESGFPVVVGGVSYNAGTVYDINNDIMIPDLIFVDDANGCDSTISLQIFDLRMPLILGFFEDGCVNGGFQLRFEYLGPLNYAGLDVVIRWKDINGYIDDGDPDNKIFTQVVSSSGTYFIEFMYTLNGVTCTYEYPYTLNISNQVPATPVPSPAWNTNFCATSTPQVYSVTSPDGNTDFQWTYPSGVTVTGETTNTLTVNWGNVLGGQICVYTSNVCGESEPYCQNIVITPIPVADFDIDPVICIDSTGSVTFNLPRIPGYIYNWSLDGGSIISTNNSNGIDSLEVMWSSAGWKYVDLIVSRNGCSSPVNRDSIEVIGRLTPPQVTCSSTDTEIIFTWAGIMNQTNVSVISNVTGLLSGNTYTVSGLLPGNNVNITVTLSSTHPCGDIMISGSCITQDCTPELISLRPIPPICLTANPALVVVKDSAITVTTNGTYSFSGPGIVDMVNGIFNPAVAGVGSHTIRFDYTDAIGCISASAFTTIDVFAVPTSVFVADDIICQDSLSRIQYTGSIPSGGTYTWNFGSDVVLPAPTGRGPFNVGWTAPGVKNVTLTTSRNGCVSSPTTIPVTVEPRIAPVVITCPNIGATVLTFDWNDVANTSGYNLTLNNVPQPQTNNSMLTLTGLGTNQTFTLTVEAISNNACPGVTSTLVCSTTDCPPISIRFNQPDTTICFGNNLPVIDIDATIIGGLQSANQVITWAGPGVNPTSGVFDPNVAGVGTHTIEFSLVDGTCTKDTSMIITVIAQPISTFTGAANVCISDNYIVTITGTPNLPLNWQLPAGVTSSPAGPNQYLISFTTDGQFTLGLLVGTASCVSDLSTIDVLVDPELDTVTISCQQTTTSITYNWTPLAECASEYEVSINGVVQGVQSNLSFFLDNLIVGEMAEIEIRPISTCACPAIATSKICEAKECPTITVNASTPFPSFCRGSIINSFQLTSTQVGSNGTGTGTWSGTGVSSTGMFNPAELSPGVYTLTYSFSEESCDYTGQVDVEIFDTPSVSVATVQPNCYQDNFGQATILAENGTAPYTYTLNGNAVTLPLADLSPAVYQVLVTDINSCTANETFTISSATEPTLVLSGNTNIISGQPTQLTATVSNLSSTIDSIVWVSLDGTIVCRGANCTTINVAPEEDETYCVTVFFNDGCNINDCITVRVQKVSVITIPNIFAPDGNNSTFFVDGFENIKNIKSMSVFDRWGNLVFLKENIAAGDRSQGWDGKLNATKVTPGVYVYKIEIVNLEDEIEIIAGDVTVL
jgi:gliding motility-associated-like protein